MDLSLIIFIVVVAFFAYRGYKHGLVRSLSRVLSLLTGYIAAILYAKHISALLQDQFPMPGITALIIASIMLFIGGGIAVNLLFWLIKKLTAKKDTTSAASSVGGATIGLVMGVLVAIVIIWTFAFVRDMRADVDAQGVENANRNTIEIMAGQVISKAVNIAISPESSQPEVTRLTAALIESPADIAIHLLRLSNSNDLQTLLQDPQNQAVLNSGDIKDVQKLPAFQQLIKNPDLLALAKSAGMMDELAGNNQAAEAALASKISDIWRRMQRVQNDKRVQDILNDPEFQKKIQSGNPVDLLTNNRLLELASIVFSDAAMPDHNTDKESKAAALKTPNKKSIIHSWTDNNGRIHYSDERQKP